MPEEAHVLNFDSLRRTHTLDRSITHGIEMTLDGNPDYVWVVKVPSQYNRAYSIAAAGSARIRFSEDGETSVAAGLEALEAQRRAFFDHCIVSVNGESVPSDFYAEFPNVVQELYARAIEAAAKLSEKVEDTAGK
jgi:hypothetical protein